MQKTLLIACLLVVASFATVTSVAEGILINTLWDAWKTQHMKSYSALEETTRFAIFTHNFHKVMKFNAENETPKLGLNKFADLTADEFKNLQAGCGFYESDTNFVNENTITLDEVQALPANVDWRNHGAVTPIKNQGQCGSCWAFSTTGVLEGLHFIKNGTLLSFSEQQIVDCDTTVDQGCDGGWPYAAVKYASANGLELETDYPYTAQDGTCQFDKSKATKVSSGYQFITANSTAQLKSAIVSQPVSVLIEADQDVFQLYSKGVIKTGCGASLDHAVLAVGYTKVGLLEAFIVKNSWGTDWGEQGYVYIWDEQATNGGQGVCGILAQPMIPIA